MSHAESILGTLEQSIPHADTELRHSNPFELLVATILSAQCTDERVNQVSPTLFKRYPGPAELAAADREQIEELIRPTGFYRNKARSIQACSQALVDHHAGTVPNRLEDLVKLPGVGRKTANLILGEVFGQPAVVVDTHVKRVASRLGLTREQDPELVERDLQSQFEPSRWYSGSSRLLLHGRYVCLARKPQCAECALAPLCPSCLGQPS